jgi:hypothetical protein
MSDKNLVVYRKVYSYSIRDIRHLISLNMTSNKGRTNRFNPFRILDKRKAYKEFGQSMAVFIQDDDQYSALDLINNSSVQCRDGWSSFMDEHFSGSYFHCQDCENIFSSDDEENNAYDDYSVCRSCCEYSYRYSDRHGYYVRDDDENYSENEHIGEYHSSSENLGHIPSKFDNRKPRVLLGLELEMEIKDSYSCDARAGELLENIGIYEGEGRYQYALCENDGSLDHGFEMVTGYTGLDVHAEQLKFFKDHGLKGAISHDSDNCGLHVHICKSDMTTLHGAKMILFINDQANQKLIKAIARRDSSDYAKFKNKSQDKQWLKDAIGCDGKRSQLRNLNHDRYEALNFKNSDTIEFRLFKGSLVYETIMSCLEFTYATWFFCRESSNKNLTMDHFLKFICANENKADTKFLRAYLKAKGFDLPEKSNVIQLQKTTLNQLKKVA